jgi:hypothetical protein
MTRTGRNKGRGTKTRGTKPAFNVVVVGQAGRLQYEAALFCASFRAAMPDFPGRLFVAEPQPGPRWTRDPRISDPAVRSLLADLGAEILPFEARTSAKATPTATRSNAFPPCPKASPSSFSTATR